MELLHATQAASITEFKKNPSKLINAAGNEPVVILNHNAVAAYLIPAQAYEAMLERLDDIELEKTIKSRLKDGKKTIKVNLDEL